jgi:hypothetical protein
MTPQEKEEEKKRLKEKYGKLFDATAALLFQHDPICINFEENIDEYELEARTILPRLRNCRCAADVTRVVHEEFVRWFSFEAGPVERYEKIGEELWRLWNDHGGLIRSCRPPIV